jgi:hypothetical protein
MDCENGMGEAQKVGDKVSLHLPFPVRRSRTGDSPDWYLYNGQGDPLYSWRVEIMPYVVGMPPWQESQSWKSPINRAVLQYVDEYSYDSASSPGSRLVADVEAFPEANAMAITGPGTAFNDGREPPMSPLQVPPSTILVVESRSTGIPWPSPGDLDIRDMPQTIGAANGKGISSRFAGGFHVLFADSQVWFLSDKIPFATLKNFFTVADAKNHDRERLLGPYVLER